MSSIRKTKKAMKKSNGFFTAIVDNGMCFCVSEWYTLRYHKKGISIGHAEYLPYNIIRKVRKEGTA